MGTSSTEGAEGTMVRAGADAVPIRCEREPKEAPPAAMRSRLSRPVAAGAETLPRLRGGEAITIGDTGEVGPVVCAAVFSNTVRVAFLMERCFTRPFLHLKHK